MGGGYFIANKYRNTAMNKTNTYSQAPTPTESAMKKEESAMKKEDAMMKETNVDETEFETSLDSITTEDVTDDSDLSGI